MTKESEETSKQVWEDQRAYTAPSEEVPAVPTRSFREWLIDAWYLIGLAFLALAIVLLVTFVSGGKLFKLNGTKFVVDNQSMNKLCRITIFETTPAQILAGHDAEIAAETNELNSGQKTVFALEPGSYVAILEPCSQLIYGGGSDWPIEVDPLAAHEVFHIEPFSFELEDGQIVTFVIEDK